MKAEKLAIASSDTSKISSHLNNTIVCSIRVFEQFVTTDCHYCFR